MASTPQLRGIRAGLTMGQASSVQDYFTTEPASIPWHPRLTPYRLIIIATTIAFGTAKAILAQRQSAAVPITLEWISGTFLSLLFFMVSSYDSREEVPSYLHWLFKLDCMDVIWRLLLAWFSIERPSYSSEERPAAQIVHRDRPLVTPYRILVCATVVSVGMSKAMLGYYGHSTDATWIDWALAVPLTIVLYCLGLYEYNPSQVWPTFFASDQVPVFYFLSNAAVGTLRLALSAAWVVYWTWSFRNVTYSPEWDMNTPRPVDYKHTMKTFLEDMFDRGLKLIMQEFILAAIAGGLSVCFTTLRQFLAKGGIPRRVLRSVRRVLAFALLKALSSVGGRDMWINSQTSDLSTKPPTRFLPNLDSPQFALRIGLHICLHLAGIAVLGTFSMLLFGMSATIFNAAKLPGHDIICRSAPYVIPSFFIFIGLGSVLGQVQIVVSMLLPFRRWYWYSTPLANSLFPRG